MHKDCNTSSEEPSSTTPMEKFRDAMGQAGKEIRPDGNDQYRCQCPGHDGDGFNLVVKEVPSGPLLAHCHSHECTAEQICDGLGLHVRDLFPGGQNGRTLVRKAKINGKQVNVHPSSDAAIKAVVWSLRQGSKVAIADDPDCVWDYRDSDGNLVGKVLRWNTAAGKEIRQIRRHESDIHNGWVCKSMLSPRPLYRLPETLKSDGPVYVCEGEKAADAVASLGLNVTSPSQGSKSPKLTNWKPLDGRSVIILPDRDEPGKKFATTVIQLLAEQAPNATVSVRHLWDDLDTLEDAGDAHDWSEHYDSSPTEILIEKLRSLPERVSEYEPTEPKPTPKGTAVSILANHIRGSEGECIGLSINAIGDQLNEITNGYPKACAGRLFVYDKLADRIQYIQKTSQLFAWIGTQTSAPPAFVNGPTCHTKSEFFEYLTSAQTQFDAVEAVPHQPPVKDIYYAHQELPESNGQHFEWLLSRFSVATEVDRELIAALFLTVFWGGPPGDRPIFLITADGHGAGKTTLAKAVAALTGGSIDVQPTEKTKELKERLLSPEGRRSRIAVIDNMKGFRISNAELEALITSSRISGREMYVGESSRPNLLTWVWTSNSPGLSRDLAQRVVTIELRRTEYSATWSADTFSYIAEHRWEIIADMIRLLQDSRQVLNAYTRWASWEREVLGRLTNADAAQTLIKERQEALDCDEEESDGIEDFIASQLRDLKYDESANVFIPSTVMRDWYSSATGEKCSTTKATRSVKRNIKDGLTEHLTHHRTETARGFVWVGDLSNELEDLLFDVEDRLTRRWRS